MDYKVEIDNYTRKALKVFEKYEVDGEYSYGGTKKNVEAWYENKTPLMNILRKHPCWNEEAKAVIFLATQTRVANLGVAAGKLMDLIYEIRCFYESSSKFYRLIEYIGAYLNKTVQECWIEKANNLGIATKMKVGQKATRAINSLFKSYVKCDGNIVDVTESSAESFSTYNKYFAEFSDSLSDHEVKRITVLSVNFIDYLLMSNGNSWATCQYINSRGLFKPESANHYSGCSKAGTLSLANDSTTMVLYTLPETYNGDDWCNEFKVSRQLFYYNEGSLVQSRLYPNCSDDSTYDSYRKTVQEIISQCCDLPNLWNLIKDVETIESSVIKGYGALHYEDYIRSSCLPTLSVNKEVLRLNRDKIVIGSLGYCIDCGNRLSSAEHLQCNCRNEKSCKACGSVHNVDDMLTTDDGSYYCRDCAYLCSHHNRVELGTPIRDRRIYGEYCSEAIEEISTYCAVCGKKELMFLMTPLSDGKTYVCNNCTDHIRSCDYCGNVALKTDFTTFENQKICNSCAKNLADSEELIIWLDNDENRGVIPLFEDFDDSECHFKYKLTRESNSIYGFTVLDMPECLRGAGGITKINGFNFCSQGYPEINGAGSNIYIRGVTRHNDNNMSTFRANKYYVIRVARALREFQKYVEEYYDSLRGIHEVAF